MEQLAQCSIFNSAKHENDPGFTGARNARVYNGMNHKVADMITLVSIHSVIKKITGMWHKTKLLVIEAQRPPSANSPFPNRTQIVFKVNSNKKLHSEC